MTNHRTSSRGLRLALALALLAGAAFIASRWSWNESTIDPELLRLLEHAPFDADGTVIRYFDLETARRGPTTEFTLENGEIFIEPDALAWSPGRAVEVSYGFSDIDRVLNVGFGGSSSTNTFVVIDGDAATALDRATAPEWAAQDTRSQEGPFDIRNWGDRDDEVQQTESSEVRPLGQAGQLTAFDGNVTLQSASTEILDAVLATENGAPTLADQEQLMQGLERIDYNNSLGMFAQIAPEGQLSTFDDAEGTVTGPTLWIVETGLDGSSRVVLGFLPGTDVTSVEEGLRGVISPIVDVSQLGVGAEALKTTAITRSDEFVVIDFVPTDPSARFGQNDEVRDFMRNLLFDNPEILS